MTSMMTVDMGRDFVDDGVARDTFILLHFDIEMGRLPSERLA